jgi:hypothetical protein
MIDHLNKLIFVHLEKAGGTSIEHIFTKIDWWNITNPLLADYDNQKEKHVKLELIKKLYHQYENYKKFTIVRNPITLFLSKCVWLKCESTITDKNINSIIDTYNKRWHINSLYDFVGDKNEYDYVIRFENYQSDYYQMLDEFNLDKNKYKLVHKNRQNHLINYQQAKFNTKALDVIKKYSEKYCEIYNYDI